MADQGDTQVFGTGKYVVFPVTGESRGLREYSVPISVTTEEGGLYVRSVFTGISSQPTQIGRLIIMD